MEQNKIPSAKDFFCQPRKYLFADQIEEYKQIVEYAIFLAMIEFAKLHVEAALKAASEKVVVKYSLIEQPTEYYVLKETGRRILFDTSIMLPVADKDSILNAYQLDEIK